MILWKSDSLYVREVIKERLNRFDNLKILDVGGGKNSWAGDAVTHVMDLLSTENESTKVIYQGDICSPNTWDSIPDKFFDFVICTHTLEDIRDPAFVVKKMSEKGKAGFIAVPSKFQELFPLESIYYRGYYHHRWLFQVNGETLSAIYKSADLTISPKATIKLSHKLQLLLRQLHGVRFNLWRFLRQIAGAYKQNRNAESLPKIEKSMGDTHGEKELSILWDGFISIEYYQEDRVTNLDKNKIKYLKIHSENSNEIELTIALDKVLPT